MSTSSTATLLHYDASSNKRLFESSQTFNTQSEESAHHASFIRPVEKKTGPDSKVAIVWNYSSNSGKEVRSNLKGMRTRMCFCIIHFVIQTHTFISFYCSHKNDRALIDVTAVTLLYLRGRCTIWDFLLFGWWEKRKLPFRPALFSSVQPSLNAASVNPHQFLCWSINSVTWLCNSCICFSAAVEDIWAWTKPLK